FAIVTFARWGPGRHLAGTAARTVHRVQSERAQCVLSCDEYKHCHAPTHSAGSRAIGSRRYLLRSHGSSTYEPHDRDEDDRADRGDDDRADQTARLGTRQDQREEPAADQGTDESEEEVSDQPVPAPLHDQASEPPCDKSHDDPSDDSHMSPPEPFG